MNMRTSLTNLFRLVFQQGENSRQLIWVNLSVAEDEAMTKIRHRREGKIKPGRVRAYPLVSSFSNARRRSSASFFLAYRSCERFGEKWKSLTG